MKILFIGDVIGSVGRDYLTNNLWQLKKEYQIDCCIANGENSAHGNGITAHCADQLWKSGVDVITMGNHVWSRKEIFTMFDDYPHLIRPANFPSSLPGSGSTVFDTGVYKVGVINAQGRIFLDPLDSPFYAVDKELDSLKKHTNIILLDFHAEATSEKGAMAWYMDGRLSAVVGTHTHIQTADETILPGGTAFISDVGMTGPSSSILGVDKDIIVNKIVHHIPARFEPAATKPMFNAVIITVDGDTGKSEKIERLHL